MRETPRLDADIGEDNIFHIAAVPDLDRNSPVAPMDAAVAHQDIPEIRFAFGAEFDGRAGGDQGAVGDHDVLAGPVFLIVAGILENDGIVAALDMAVRNPHVFTVVRVDPIGIGHFQIIQKPDSVDEHIVAAHQMDRPERTVDQSDIPYRQMVYRFQKKQRHAGIIRPLDVVSRIVAIEDTLISVDCPLTGNGNILFLQSVNKRIKRSSRILAV